ncbi:MAG TPA: hypothetical protein PK605_00590 [Ignavibacteria bacterium]|nr:hypothetical protein [Bacteroidota bacterium]HRE11700.1 hypothetical protein [Ignavibacteria bacterium]HRF66037.1 hypothetical protein [Ignavibacteria bacterium]HRJ02877.1 hypothetical protein [Ignavibacteria bacterium]
MNKIKLFSFLVLTAAMVWIWGCGDDSTTGPVNPGGDRPNIEFKTGSGFTFTFDTLSRVNGSAVRLTNMSSRDSVEASFPIGSNTAYRIVSRTDSAGNISFDTALVYYDSGAGKLYQYGISRLINPAATANWDLVGDFSIANGTSWNIPLNPDSVVINGFAVKVVLSAKVVGPSTFQTTGSPTRDVHCYQIEFKADLTYIGLPVGSIYFDYFVGYNNGSSNTSGLVRFRLNPVNIGIPPTLVIQNFGVDKKTATFNIP